MNSLYFPLCNNFNERKPTLSNGVLLIPNHYSDHGEVKDLLFSDHNFLEGIKKTVAIEICSGNGMWIVEKALQYPEIFWIAVEKKHDRAKKIWSRMKVKSVNNLFIIVGMAEDFFENYLHKQLFDQIYVNFPDPWLKRRDAKNRLLKTSFLSLLAKYSKKDCQLQLVTDSKSSLDETINNCIDSKVWSFAMPAPYYQENLKSYGDSFFKSFWENRKSSIYYLKLERENYAS